MVAPEADGAFAGNPRVEPAARSQRSPFCLGTVIMDERQARRERWRRSIQHLDGLDREDLVMRLWFDEQEQRGSLLDAKPSDACADVAALACEHESGEPEPLRAPNSPQS